MTCKSVRWRAGLTALTAVLMLGACSSDDKPSSLAGGGGTNQGGHAGSSAANAGASGSATTSSGGSSATGGGPTGDGGASPMPVAVFQTELEVDVGCDGVTPGVNLLIQNAGDEPLVISSANADSGYLVTTPLPLQIAPGAAGNLQVMPPAPSDGLDAGAVSTGQLSFTTNEPGAPAHEVTLTTTLYVGSFEFTDSDGLPIKTLTLSYGSGSSCPDPATYRIHNTGNVAFTVLGPTFPTHFSGTDLGANGQAIPPDGYAELLVGGVSAPGAVCNGAGELAFSVTGVFCGAVPQLAVEWPLSIAPNPGSSCACAAP
jgi:hypothetical protein